MKSKQQKRQEAIARASVSYHVKRWDKRGLSLEEYLNQFRSADERVIELGEPEFDPDAWRG